MLQSNGRIENLRGIRFYEQDILFDDYTFSDDVTITLAVDYVSPGIGIALINNEGLSIQEKNEAYLFRLGYKEVSVVRTLSGVQKVLLNTAINVAPLIEDMKFIFNKRGRKITVSVDGHGVLFEYMLAKSMDKFNIGIYSNAGNIIKSIAIAAKIPEDWIVNMNNTNGGYIKFFNNGFQIENCVEAAEVEQYNVSLKAGTYYLRYDKQNIDDQNDIVAYVYSSADTRLFDDEKNILDKKVPGKIVLEKDTKVNLKFKGKQGLVKNIHISDKAGDKYVASTEEGSVTVEGSYIDIFTKDLKEIRWSGEITEVPEYTLTKSYSVIEDHSVKYILGECGIVTDVKYDFIYDVINSSFQVYEGTVQKKAITLTDVVDKITIFKNVNAIINKFTLIQKDGEVINLIAEETSKRYVPGTVTSPIIVVDEENLPLELSSSYRVINNNGLDKYIFTNYEREYFEPAAKIKMTKKISGRQGTVKVYGVRNDAEVNFDNILRLPKEGMDTISDFCDKFDTINESELFGIDRNTGSIYLKDISNYKLLIVDYLKEDSYCINYRPEIRQYEVDISTSRDNVSILYDHDDQGIITNLTSYKLTDISPEDNCYIVLRREDF